MEEQQSLLSIRWKQVTSLLVLILSLWSIIWELVVVLLETSMVLSHVPVSSLLSFHDILGHFQGIIICAGILSFKLPWYYRTLPRYYHMCRYLLSYTSAVLSHVPISSLLGFRSNSPLYGIRLNQILILHLMEIGCSI